MSVKVAIRVRPFNQRQIFLGCTTCVQMKDNTTIVSDNKEKNKKQHYFTFDYSLWSHDQFGVKENGYMYPLTNKYIDQIKVYNLIGTQILANALQGYNCCLFAYGQTGSGKSYSMIGYGANKGIVPMACQEIFAKIKKNQVKGQKQYQITFSMLQIYNQKVQDLFTATSKRPQNGLKVRQNKTLGVYVQGLTKIEVHSYADIERRMDEGSKNRSLASTLMNEYSSRAHTIIMIEFIQKEWINKLKMNKKSSLINLVDLAGSQRVAKTGIESKDRLKQASNINKSLHTLGRVIQTLAELSVGKIKNIQVPYRDSSLTRILQGALGGNSKTIMICAISPANDNYQETLSTLRYADQTKRIKNKPVINESAVDKIIRQLRQQNERLKKMLEAPEQYSIMISNKPSKIQSQQKEIRSNLKASMRQVQKEIRKNLKSFAINTDEVQEENYQSMMMTQFIDLQEKSQFFSEVSFDLGNKAQIYITNLNQDQLLNDKIRYSCDKNILITNKNRRAAKGLQEYAKIVLCGLGVEENHAKILKKGDKYFIQALTETSAQYTLLNGKPVYQIRELVHNDRIILGINSVFLFKNNMKKDEYKQKRIDYEFAINERQQQMQNLSLISPTSLNIFLTNKLLQSPLKQIYNPSSKRTVQEQNENEKQIIEKLQNIQVQFSKLVKENEQKLKQKQQFYKKKLHEFKQQQQKQKFRTNQIEQKLMVKSLQTETLRNKNSELQKLKAKLSKYNQEKDKRKKYRQSFLLQSQENKIEEDIIGQFVDVEAPISRQIDFQSESSQINIKRKKKIQINATMPVQYQEVIVEEVDDNLIIMNESIDQMKINNKGSSKMNQTLLLGGQEKLINEKKEKRQKIDALKKKLTQDSIDIEKQKERRKNQKNRLQFIRVYNFKIKCQIQMDIICASCHQKFVNNQDQLIQGSINQHFKVIRSEIQQYNQEDDKKKKKRFSAQDLKILSDQIGQLEKNLLLRNQEQSVQYMYKSGQQSLLLKLETGQQQTSMTNLQMVRSKMMKQSQDRKYSQTQVDLNLSQDKSSNLLSKCMLNNLVNSIQNRPALSLCINQVQYKIWTELNQRERNAKLAVKLQEVNQQVVGQNGLKMSGVNQGQFTNPFAVNFQSQEQLYECQEQKQLIKKLPEQDRSFVHPQNRFTDNKRQTQQSNHFVSIGVQTENGEEYQKRMGYGIQTGINTDINMWNLMKSFEQQNHQQQQQIQRYINASNKPQNNQTLNSTINQSISFPHSTNINKSSLDSAKSHLQHKHQQVNTAYILLANQATNTSIVQQKNKFQHDKSEDDQVVQNYLKDQQILVIEQLVDWKKEKLRLQSYIEQLQQLISMQRQQVTNLSEPSDSKAEKQQIMPLENERITQDYGLNTSLQEDKSQLISFGINTSLQLEKIISQQLQNKQNFGLKNKNEFLNPNNLSSNKVTQNCKGLKFAVSEEYSWKINYQNLVYNNNIERFQQQKGIQINLQVQLRGLNDKIKQIQTHKIDRKQHEILQNGLSIKQLSQYVQQQRQGILNRSAGNQLEYYKSQVDPYEAISISKKKSQAHQQFMDKFHLSVSDIQRHDVSYQQSLFGLDGLLKEDQLNFKIKLLEEKIKQLQIKNKQQHVNPAETLNSKQETNVSSMDISSAVQRIIESQQKQDKTNPSKYVPLSKKKKRKKQSLTQQEKKQLQIERQLQAKIIQCNNQNLINQRNLQIHKRRRQGDQLRKVLLKRQKVQLQKQLLVLIPMIRRFNLIARQMKRLVQGKISIDYRNFSHYQMVEVLKNYRMNKKSYASNLQIKIVIFNCEQGRLYTWNVDIFKNRYEIAEQIFEKYLESEDAVGSRFNNYKDASQRIKDPFWDPVDYISQGIGYLSMESLLYNINYEGYISLIYKSNIIAKIYVAISPVKIQKHREDQQELIDESSQIESIEIYNQRNLLEKDIYFTISIESIKFMTNNQKQKQEKTQQGQVNLDAINSNITKYTISYQLLEDQYRLVKYSTAEICFNQQKQFKKIDYMRQHSFKNISETTLTYINDCPIKFTLNVMKDYNEQCLNASFAPQQDQTTEGQLSQFDKSYASIEEKITAPSKSVQSKQAVDGSSKSDFTKKGVAAIYENTEIVSRIQTQAKKEQQRLEKIYQLEQSKTKNKGIKEQKDKQCNIY